MRVADNPYADSYQVRGISAGTYLRLELHRLLPEVDKIMYTDVDIPLLRRIDPFPDTIIIIHVRHIGKAVIAKRQKGDRPLTGDV